MPKIRHAKPPLARTPGLLPKRAPDTGQGVSIPMASAHTWEGDAPVRGRLPALLGAEATRTQSARPEGRRAAPTSARERALARWRVGGSAPGAGLLVRPLLAGVVAQLREGPFSCVEIWLASVSAVGDDSFGPEVRGLSAVRPMLYAKPDRGIDARTLGQAVFHAVFEVLGRHPQAGHWLVSAERGHDQAITCVHVFADARRPAFSLQVTGGRTPQAAAALPPGAVVCKLTDGDVLWRTDEEKGVRAWDAAQAGLYAPPDVMHARALSDSWAQRTCGWVPQDPGTDRSMWSEALGRRSDAWPAALDSLLAPPSGHTSEMVKLATLANAWLSAEAQTASLAGPIKIPHALLRDRLSVALEQTTVTGPFVALHLVRHDASLTALRIWSQAWALPQRLARDSKSASAPSIESVYVTSDGSVQLRLRLAEGCFLSPTFSPANALQALAPCTLSSQDTGRLSLAWLSPMHASRLSAAVLGEPRLMALWTGAEAPTSAHLRLAARRLMTLAAKAQGVQALQLTQAAGALCPKLALDLWPAQLHASQGAWTQAALAPFVALWTAQLRAGLNAQPTNSSACLDHMHLALHGLRALHQTHALPVDQLFAQLQPCVVADHPSAADYAPFVSALLQAARVSGALSQAVRLLGDERLHHQVKKDLCAAFARDDAAFVRAVAGHIEALCAVGDVASASSWLASADVAQLHVTDVVRLQLIVAGVKPEASTVAPTTLIGLVDGLHDADASLQCFVNDKKAWRALCRTTHLTRALGTLLTRTSAPPIVLWEMWQNAADNTLSVDALGELLGCTTADHAFAWRLARARCARSDDIGEVWSLMRGYGLSLSPAHQDTPRKLAAIVEAGCCRLQHLGLARWAACVPQGDKARDALRTMWTRYAPGDNHAATLQTRLRLLDLRYVGGDTSASLIDAASLVDVVLKHPKWMGPWIQHVHTGLETLAMRAQGPSDAVLDALVALADVSYPAGRTHAADLVSIGGQLVFSFVQWDQLSRAAAVLDKLAHRLNGAELIAMIHACTIGRGENKTILPITLQSCTAWLMMLEGLLQKTQTPSMYLVLVDGHLQASLKLLAEATLTVDGRVDEDGSVVSDASDEVEALDAHDTLWLQSLNSIVDLHARCPIARSRPVQRQLTETLGRLQAHDDLGAYLRLRSDAGHAAMLLPLWRAWVLSTTDRQLAQARAAHALKALGIDIEAALAPQIKAMPTPAQADAAVAMLVDLGGVLVGAQATPQARLQRFDAIAGVMLAGGYAVHRWSDLISTSSKSLTAEIAKRRLAVLAQLVVQGLAQDRQTPASVAYTALSLVYYAEHVLAPQYPAQAQTVGNALCVYAQKQTTYRRDAWANLLGSLDTALSRKGLRLGAALKVLEALRETAPELAAQGLSMHTVRPPHLSCGVKDQLAHPDAMQAEIGFHYFVVGYGQMNALSDSARAQMQGALVEALRWSHVRTNAFDEMRRWDLTGVDAGLVTDIFAALRTATQWNASDINGIVAVFVAAADQGANAKVWAPIVTQISASVAHSPYMPASQAFKRAQVVLRATPWLRPLADALDVMLG